ncbi:FG-GAP-like repeat-containing protein [Haloferula sp.]|uniref:FG-GAP-like repeat-containing protein n=1 Tax=Haloferula sp. TaxID=2497595 RepID=UPI00329DD235
MIAFLSRYRFRPLRLGLACGLLTQAAGGAIVSFTEATDPVGIFSSSSNVETNTTVSTRSAIAISGDNSFTHWTINGVRQSDPSGRSSNQVSFLILEPSAAVAHYLPTTQDGDADGIPDWYEIEFFGDLTADGTTDGDGDGLSLNDELGRSTSPRVHDEFQEGGVSRRRGLKVVVVAPSEVSLVETSDPPGIVDATRAVTDGATVSLSLVPEVSGGQRFVGWHVGGERIDSALNLQPTMLTVDGETTVTARYVEEDIDSEPDGIPDWYELFHFDDLSRDGDSDSDDDGFSLSQELIRGQSPHLDDGIIEGGISRRRGTGLEIISVTMITYTLASDPVGLIDEVKSAAAGSEVTTDDLWGTELDELRFVGWSVDGVLEKDPSGAASGRAQFSAEQGVVATARFVSPTEDSDLDGLPDWYELAYLGNLDSTGSSNHDGDGFDLAREALLGLSPLQTDAVVEGGISRRRSSGTTAVNLQPFERLRHVLVYGLLREGFSEDPAVSPPTGFDFGDGASPALCDWDGDGDFDLFICSEGELVVYENRGTRFNMNLVLRTAHFGGLLSLCAGIDRPLLTAGDWNLDGNDDLILSDGEGGMHFIPSDGSFLNIGSGSASGLASPSEEGTIPALGDLDGNGSADLLLASPGGLVEFFPHSGNPESPYDAAASGGMDGVQIPEVSSLSIADFTLDGRNDVLAADREGRIWEFHADPGGDFVLTSKVWGGSGVGFAPAPLISAGDLDGDGDIDLVGGVADGGIFALRDPKLGRPTGLVAAAGAGSVMLEWDPDRQSRIKGYNVYRATSSEVEKVRINAEPAELPEYLDADLQPAPESYYHVTALTQAIYAGNSEPILLESLRSETVSVTVRNVSIGLKDARGFPGSNVFVLLSIENSVGLRGEGLDIRIQYPPQLIPFTQRFAGNGNQEAFKTVRPSGLARNLSFTSNEVDADGELRILGDGGFLEAGQGKLFTLVFGIDDEAIGGLSHPITIESAAIQADDGSPKPVTVGDAVVEVVERPGIGNGVEVGAYGLGDVTGNGWVNAQDRELFKTFLGPDPATPTEDEMVAADTNGDGRITARDLLGISRIILGLDP